MIKFFNTLFAKLKERHKKKKRGKAAINKIIKELPNAEVTKISDKVFKIEANEELSIEQIEDIIKRSIEEG